MTMSNFDFTSQICTSCSQSERLLALGLKKETADCVIMYYDGWHVGEAEHFDFDKDPVEPAWSLNRLIEMMPSNIIEDNKRYHFSLDQGCSLYEYDETDEFGDHECDCTGTSKNTSNLYDDLINQIEWLIERNHFNKEYLEK